MLSGNILNIPSMLIDCLLGVVVWPDICELLESEGTLPTPFLILELQLKSRVQL